MNFWSLKHRWCLNLTKNSCRECLFLWNNIKNSYFSFFSWGKAKVLSGLGGRCGIFSPYFPCYCCYDLSDIFIAFFLNNFQFLQLVFYLLTLKVNLCSESFCRFQQLMVVCELLIFAVSWAKRPYHKVGLFKSYSCKKLKLSVVLPNSPLLASILLSPSFTSFCLLSSYITQKLPPDSFILIKGYWKAILSFKKRKIGLAFLFFLSMTAYYTQECIKVL